MSSESVLVGTVWFVDRRCPKCGAALITNGSLVWCSFSGDGRVAPCDFGVGTKVKAHEIDVAQGVHP